ncbi:hypothetical protein [Corynebacterium pygosceleis]|uniref:hypothetical protein n=1 Tax=Corynebacterium pygosceleis TaxID=2800406 RepID=UPI002005B38D|nr:hypothetical protein [Corynebacterium pygosceleis]MCK7676352.1 hypothetical protein [Corynebacterium pygosceleis]
MDFTPRTEMYGAGDYSWLGSAHATNNMETVTLKVSAFASFKTDHGDVIPAGIPLKKSSAGKTYEPVTDAGDALAGFLGTPQPNRGDNQVAPMLWHGSIKADNLPKGAFDVTTLTAANPQFHIKKKEA